MKSSTTRFLFSGMLGAALMVCGSHSWARGTRTIAVDDGATRTPVSVSRTLATMPASGGGSSQFQVGGTTAFNLGTFDIVIVPGPTLAGNAPALAAFNRAAQQWETFIADPITVTVNADLAPLGTGILGSANSVDLFAGYTTIRNALVADASDEVDDSIGELLPTAGGFSAFLPTGFGFDGNLQLTKANAKALGFANLDTNFGVSDGSITFSTNFAFDFDNSNGISPGQFDFESVAAHEIGHVLGFTSDVDFVDALLDMSLTSLSVRPTPLDLFRFDDGAASDPSTNTEFGVFPRSMVPGNAEIFEQISAAFGGDVEVLMSTGVSQGDGRQASHWKDGLGLGLLDPTLAAGQTSHITANDWRALDLIGYEITVVPEPSGALLMMLGCAVVAARRYHRGRVGTMEMG